jgi:tagatose 1,6-diphosphate aldolase GatY/KbaY
MLKAAEERYAVGAFNVTNIIQMEAVVEAAVEMDAPLIIQASVTPSKFLGKHVRGAVYRALAERASIPICLHLDHCTDVAFAKACADAGYTNIMIDGSRLSYEENIRVTREVADYCHSIGNISVEGELGTVSGVEDQIRVTEDAAQLADPEQSVGFVERSGVDIFAPAIGTAHGHYKTANPKVHFDRFERINQLLNGDSVRVPVVVHGGSGLPADTVRRLVQIGGAKFNVSTDLKHALLDATYEYISDHRDEYNPGKVDVAVKDAIRHTVGNWIDLLGSAGKA